MKKIVVGNINSGKTSTLIEMACGIKEDAKIKFVTVNEGLEIKRKVPLKMNLEMYETHVPDIKDICKNLTEKDYLFIDNFDDFIFYQDSLKDVKEKLDSDLNIIVSMSIANRKTKNIYGELKESIRILFDKFEIIDLTDVKIGDKVLYYPLTIGPKGKEVKAKIGTVEDIAENNKNNIKMYIFENEKAWVPKENIIRKIIEG